MIHRTLAAALCLLLTPLIQAEPPEPFQAWEKVEDLNQGWQYSPQPADDPSKTKEASFSPVNLPHCWNATDAFERKDYRRAASLYRRELKLTEADLKQRLFLRVGAANSRARLYFNGHLVTEHAGGYSAFGGEITPWAKAGGNRIELWVTNAHDPAIAPHSADFTFYGGVYRSVELLRAPTLCLRRDDRAGPGCRLRPTLESDGSGKLAGECQVHNGSDREASFKLSLSLLDPSGTQVAEAETGSLKLAADTARSFPLPAISLPQVRKWSPESPTLYEAVIRITPEDGSPPDSVRQRTGFRSFRFTIDSGFRLNGEPYTLRGVNRHQDRPGKGNALSRADHYQDIKLMKEAGVNWLRLAHYQQDDYVLQLCDQMGLLVWEEIPYVNSTSFTPDFERNLQSMLLDMITQHFNHPSIIVWGMGNEVRMKDRGDGKAKCYDIVKGLNELVHREDPSRPSAFVVGDTNNPQKLGVMLIPDIVGYNLYHGWYRTSTDTLTARLEQLHRMHPDQPLLVTEYGAGSDLEIHSANPARYDFSEEYQLYFLEEHLKQLEKLDFIAGANWWCFADFGSANRGDSMPHINQKGLVSFDRKQLKDAYHLIKARWTDTPVLQIQSKRWLERRGNGKQRIRVITNLKDVKLLHNGRDLGAPDAEGPSWLVELESGKHRFTARAKSGGESFKDEVEFNYERAFQDYDMRLPEGGQGSADALADRSPATRWAIGGPAVLEMDLRKARLLDGVYLGFYRGDQRSYRARLEVSKDGRSWREVMRTPADKPAGTGSKRLFEEQQFVRYLRLKVDGNSENSWSAINEFSPLLASEKREKSRYENIKPEED